MSDAETPTDPSDARDEQAVSDEEFEPVQVFPESEEMDLRPGSDDCYKCSTCDSACPVAEVDDEFPGPKFQGPEQWRVKRKDDHDIDDSVMSCSNCMRCDSACPSDVPLSQMHNTARGQFVEEQMEKLSREYVRNRILANYGTLAGFASKVPRLANFVMGNSFVQSINEKLLGITSEREFPEFADQTFREWWHERGGNATSEKRAREARAKRDDASADADDKRVAYFHGCYSNYNTPEVGKSMVRTFEHFGYEVMVPPQQCSGTPMFANGMLADAERAAETNVRELAAAIEDGADIIASCTSCSMSLRQEYPELFSFEGTASVAARTYEALEYLRLHEDLDAELADAKVEDAEFAYHAPCHARNQGLAGQAVEVLDNLTGANAEDVGDSCSGISGTYGWKEEKYDTSMEIGAEMFDHMEDTDAETGMTECPTCAMQMEHGTGYEIRHPLEVLDEALVERER
ncbi:anaerobic glycerol-3-phosphate dehydrogenase subunit C [Halorussus pelagicus]|uniref:anaerobic glycerol-3-phosphate dehydrogenase subunit C n=1 Tax=Halorussus pelagicus TaxID=2505977 RepID=UPI000FFBADF5|nr:anaerobic glycerol-3-phosphate dehydrogenase subunit C [Halorussus pelagicus]